LELIPPSEVAHMTLASDSHYIMDAKLRWRVQLECNGTHLLHRGVGIILNGLELMMLIFKALLAQMQPVIPQIALHFEYVLDQIFMTNICSSFSFGTNDN
jgi:hypothetical protein